MAAPIYCLSNIGNSAVQFNSVSTLIAHGILLIADPRNAGTLAVGFSNAVTCPVADLTSTAGDATVGIPLQAGNQLYIPIGQMPTGKISDIWVIGLTATAQRLLAIVD